MPQQDNDYQKLVTQLVSEGTLVTPEIIDAFKLIDRINFLPKELKMQAGVNSALPIGSEQTISQPFTVAFMLELLKPEKSQQILDIGSGSGWQAALLAEIVGEKGKVIALEIVSELVAEGKKNAALFSFKNIQFIKSDGSKGYQKEAPFDRIIGAAAIPKVPQVLKDQLKIGGRMVLPVGITEQEIVLITRESEKEFREEHFPGFVFVPMLGEYGVDNR